MVQQRTPAVRKANKETANAAAKVAAAAAAAAVTTTAAATAAAVPLGRSPGGDALIDSRMFARNVTVRARAPWAERCAFGLVSYARVALFGHRESCPASHSKGHVWWQRRVLLSLVGRQHPRLLREGKRFWARLAAWGEAHAVLSRSANCLLKWRSPMLQGVMTMSDAMMIPPALIVPGSMAPPALPVQVGPERSPAWAHDVQGVGGSPCGGALWGEGLYVLPLA